MTGASFSEDYSRPEPEKRVLRAVIRGLGADMLVLQEMVCQRYLYEPRRDLVGEGATIRGWRLERRPTPTGTLHCFPADHGKVRSRTPTSSLPISKRRER